MDKGTHVCEPQCPLHKRGIIAPIYRDMCWNSGKKKNRLDAVTEHTWGPWERLQSLAGVGMGGHSKGEMDPQFELRDTAEKRHCGPLPHGGHSCSPLPITGFLLS